MSATGTDTDAVAAGAGAVQPCRDCGLELSPAFLACPRCHALVFAAQLKELVRRSDEARAAGDLVAASTTLREAQQLLPITTKQHTLISERIVAINVQIAARGETPPDPHAKKSKGGGAAAAGLTGFGLLAWKLKAFALVALGPAKILLLGLTKMSTLVTMALAFGVYWTIFGWRFALGLIVTTYIHEMGHVIALRNRGMTASAPMFLPGIGAYVRLKHRPVDAEEDAAIGLAGPLYGAAAASIAFAIGALSGASSWLAIARVTAWINLFNLLPLGPLDGGRALRALSRDGRILVAILFFATAALGHEGIAALAGLLTLLRAFETSAPAKSVRAALAPMGALVIILGALAAIEVPNVAAAGGIALP